MSETVTYQKVDRVAHITLNRPDALNAFNSELDQALREALSDFDLDPDLWIAIVSGNGRSFCAGHDLRQPSQAERLPSSRLVHYLLDAPVNWKPVIAAVHGHCYGFGLVFAAECDLVVATEDASFCVIETKRGIPSVTLFAQLAHSVGVKNATEMTLTAEPISASDAHRMGLVSRVVPSREDLIPAAEQLASEILQNPPLPVRVAVQAARTSVMNSAIMHEADLLLRNSGFKDWEDFGEGIRAFREGRLPEFKAK